MVIRFALDARLAAALLASLAVHVCIATAVRDSVGTPGVRVPDHRDALELLLADADHETRLDATPISAQPSIVATAKPSSESTPERAPVTMPPSNNGATAAKAMTDALSMIEAQTLATSSLLPEDILSRQASEFRHEVDVPSRLRSKVRAVYPPAELAAGSEDTVILWIVVGATGDPEEVVVVAGAPAFAEAAKASLADAQFSPAADAEQGVRYPIALVFRFVRHPGASAKDSLPADPNAAPSRDHMTGM